MTALNRIRLPDHVSELPACPADTARAVLAIDQHARDCGVRLYPQADLTALRRVFRDNAVSERRLGPLYDPAYHRLTPDNAFWIAGIDAAGAVVATAATRIFEIDGSTLRDEAESMRLFAPGRFKATRFSGPAAARIGGRTAVSNAAWIHPDLDGKPAGVKLARVMRRATAFLANAMRPIAYSVAWIRTASSVAVDYGFDHVEDGADFVRTDDSLVRNSFLWSDARELDNDMEWCRLGALRRPLTQAH